MRRSPANSTNRPLAAFGKLQHIRLSTFGFCDRATRPPPGCAQGRKRRRVLSPTGHCQVDENSVESPPQGIAISSELEHNILGIDLGCLPAT